MNFDQLLELGQHPKEKSDTVTILEKIGHFLDEENSQHHAKKNEISDKQKCRSILLIISMFKMYS